MHDTTDAGGPWTLGVLRPAIWLLVAGIGVAALSRGAPVTAFCAASSLFLAAMPRAFTALSGLRFPAGLSTGVLVFVAAALLAGEMGGLYETTAWFDVALHLWAAAVLAQVGWALVLLMTAGAPPAVPLWVGAVVAFAVSMMIGALWEVFEFAIDATFGTRAQRSGLPDTMTDLIADAAGAFYGAVAVQRHLKRGDGWIGHGLVVEWMRLNPLVYGEWPRWSALAEQRRRRALAAEDRPL